MNRKYAFLLAFALVGGLVVACGGGMAEEPVAEGGGDASGDVLSRGRSRHGADVRGRSDLAEQSAESLVNGSNHRC